MSDNYNDQNENDYSFYGNDQNGYGNQQNSYGTQSDYDYNQSSYGNQPQYQYQPDTGRYEKVEANEMTVGKWLLTFLLYAIPIVNIVMLIVWAVGNNPKNAVRKTWAKAQLIWMAIAVGVCVILTILLTIFFASMHINDTKKYSEDLFAGSDEFNYDESDVHTEDSLANEKPEDTGEKKQASSAAPLSGTWEDMTFCFDGQEYTLPFAYSEIAENGWTFDMADYGYENGYVMNAGDKTYATFELENPEYKDVSLMVGFVNNSDSVKDITECDIYVFSYNTCYGFEQVENFPPMSISGGLMIGMDEASAVAIMGECESVYESEYYNNYTYNNEDYSKYLDFDVCDEYGVTSIELTLYR